MVLINHRSEPVKVFWVNSEGESVPYGELAPGARREQHTYAGHVWLITSRAGERLGVFEAAEKSTEAVIGPGAASPPPAVICAASDCAAGIDRFACT